MKKASDIFKPLIAHRIAVQLLHIIKNYDRKVFDEFIEEYIRYNGLSSDITVSEIAERMTVALFQFDHYSISERMLNPIALNFDWSDTKKGYEFWAEINRNLRKQLDKYGRIIGNCSFIHSSTRDYDGVEYRRRRYAIDMFD